MSAQRWDRETRHALTCALDVAASAPLRVSKYAAGARIPWSEVTRLREAFDALGIDWRAVHEAKRAASRGEVRP